MDLNFSCNENANNKEISSNSINVTTSLAVNLLPSHSSFLHSTAIPSQQVTSLKSSENFLQTVPGFKFYFNLLVILFHSL